MKILHFTDPHLVGGGKLLYGCNPAERFKTLLDHAMARHPDAAAMVITGDLVDEGAIEAYEELQSIIKTIAMPVHVTLGNHDNRANFRAVFGGEGSVDTHFDVAGWRVVLVDTLKDGSAMGELDDGQLSWLDEALGSAQDRQIVIGMHHPPHSMHLPAFERMKLGTAEFFDIAKRHGNVRHMLLGHVHIGAAGSIKGIPFTVLRGSDHHILYNLRQNGRSDFVAGPPAYDVVMLSDDAVIIHREEGLEKLPLIRVGDPI